jgi:restriction system protein
MNKNRERVPTYDQMMVPTVRALQALGGSGSVREIYAKVSEILSLSDAILDVPHGNSSMTEVEYRLMWSRTYLHKFGVLERSSRGVWAVSPNAPDADALDPKVIVRTVREMGKQAQPARHDEEEMIDPVEQALSGAVGATQVQTLSRTDNADKSPDTEPRDVDALAPSSTVEPEGESYRAVLLQTILALPPSGFERLCQRLLREAGFEQVVVTGKSGDGGIDGHGILQINPFVSFRVLFQCKRYTGSVGAPQIREFRGAMMGRADKGIILTTGRFTAQAQAEALGYGSSAIELVNGERLIDMFESLQLGLKPRRTYDIDPHFFAEFAV